MKITTSTLQGLIMKYLILLISLVASTPIISLAAVPAYPKAYPLVKDQLICDSVVVKQTLGHATTLNWIQVKNGTLWVYVDITEEHSYEPNVIDVYEVKKGQKCFNYRVYG